GEHTQPPLVHPSRYSASIPIDSAVDRRVRRQLAEQQMTAARDSRSPTPTDSFGERFGFGIVSLVLAIPLSAIGGGVAHLPGMLVAWAGIVGVNVVQAARINPALFGRRPRTGRGDAWED
ncbi:hypothetical protein, partial [Streptomyces ardesiacus]|uniref:hypothetical protein n=1 Tax=Streptomyces ardesiacus TaxID=285564 RepID=UPI0036A1A91D